MGARLFSLGLWLGLSVLAVLGCSPLAAAQAAGVRSSAVSVPATQPQFRPWGRSEAAPVSARTSRPRFGPAPRATVPVLSRRAAPPIDSRSGWQGAGPDIRAGSRKAVPVTRGQDLGLRFRPDDRDPAYGRAAVPTGAAGAGDAAGLQSQFRPMRPARKPTYEELQAEQAARQYYPVPANPQPLLPPPPGQGGYWPAW